MFSPNKKSDKYFHSQALLNEQALLIDSLEKKLESQKPLVPHLASLDLPTRPGPDKKAYALDLLGQIKEKHLKVIQDRLESQKPAFPNGGFPNFAFTPDNLRKEQQKSLKTQVKQDLEEQIRSKHFQVRSEKLEKIEAEKKKNLEMIQKFEEEKQEKNFRSFMENKILTESWEKASKTKWLQSQIDFIENFGVRSRSVIQKEENFQRLSTPANSKKESGESSGELQRKSSYFAKEVRGSRELKGKAEKERSSYQLKIRKIMQAVKSSKNISRSLSPSHFSSKKYIELRHKLLKKH